MAHDLKTLFAGIDTMVINKFTDHLTDDVRFRFGNAEHLNGKAPVSQAITGFWSSINGMKHHLRNSWDVEGNTTIVYAEVEYTRKDGKKVICQNTDILKWRGEQVYDWQIFIDLAPVYAA